MKYFFGILIFVLTVNILTQCKTGQKKQTTQEPTKPTLTKIENKQDAAQAIVAASQTFVSADCQGNSTCQSVQTQAAVLANADPVQLETVLTPDNIQQATAEITNSVTASSTDTNTNTNTNINTEQNTNVNTNTNTSVSVSKPSRASPVMKNAGISLMVIGGGIFVLSAGFAIREALKKPHVPPVSQTPSPPQTEISSTEFPFKQDPSALDIAELKHILVELKKLPSNEKAVVSADETFLKQLTDGLSYKVSQYIAPPNAMTPSRKEILREIEVHMQMILLSANQQYLEIDYVISQIQRRLDLLNVPTEDPLYRDIKLLRDHLEGFKHYADVEFANIHDASLDVLDERLHQKGITVRTFKAPSPPPPPSAPIEPVHEEHVVQKSYKNHGIAAAVFGAVLASVGGALYANSGVGLAAGTANDPLTVYFTSLGQIAQQLTP